MLPKNDILQAIALHDCDLALVIDCASGHYQLCHASQAFSILPESGDYTTALLSAHEQIIYPKDRQHFLNVMELPSLQKALAASTRSTCRVLFRRKAADAGFVRGEARFFYRTEERQEIVLSYHDVHFNDPVSLYTTPEISIFDPRSSLPLDIRKMYTSLTVLDVRSRRICSTPHYTSILNCQSYEEQIQWFAENLVVPEEREQFLRFFELDHLLATVRASHGFCSTHYTFVVGEQCHNFILCIYQMAFPGQEGREYLVGYSLDITHLQQTEMHTRKLLEQSSLDTLTGITNRQAAERDIARHLLMQAEDEQSLLLVLDVDNFKFFNDHYGHQTGDAVLVFMARTLKSTFRKDDIVCRWGGDEFLVLLKNVRSVDSVSNRLRRLCTTTAGFTLKDIPLPVTMSIGGALAKGARCNLQDLFRAADSALYAVKRGGRNGFVCADGSSVHRFCGPAIPARARGDRQRETALDADRQRVIADA